ncbi:adenine phosphoribosyltransferase [Bifidobacterium dolichotidis]|uniref:Adenine phosphoribosyltransferase n=1 Tax=Bifidobacterium dolichotidis TaxID=2306976 RepID=A0A430FT38_9BIFI|nr:adenine phosphoribosyltransferase [Bifidobacterium dolichotidis]RSX56043.1 adenine phosphoribosyltransferase [Bifidobacterium dolichotidis]
MSSSQLSTDITMNAALQMNEADADYLVSRVRTIRDFPKQGILFRDFMPIFADAKAFGLLMDALIDALPVPAEEIDMIAGLEARGFLFGPALANRLGKGFIAVRKAGKLPPPTKQASYSLEYGTAEIEVEDNLIEEGKRVLIVDDLIATGGSAQAARDLIEQCGGTVAGFSFVMELVGLDGVKKLGDYPVESLMKMPA